MRGTRAGSSYEKPDRVHNKNGLLS